LLGKARILASQHNIKDAIPIYEQLVGLVNEPGSKAALIDEEARIYAGEKMTSEADAAYKRAIAEFPSVLGTHIAYGDYYAAQNQLPKAEAEWTLALGPNKDNPDALARLGDVYLRQNQPQKAIEQLKRLTAVAPRDAAAFNALGQGYSAMRQFDKARDAYRRSFELLRTPAALAGLGTADFEMKNYREGATIFDAIDKNAGDFLKANPQLYFVMGKCYEGTNQKSKAKAAYTKLLSYVKPGSPQESQVKKLISDLDRGQQPQQHNAGAKPSNASPAKKKS
jgi:tetratricopeptide (TPR) repeat protein